MGVAIIRVHCFGLRCVWMTAPPPTHPTAIHSVTYYVSGGEAPGPTSAQTNGCLVFRGGEIR